jgi:hypothetical protein
VLVLLALVLASCGSSQRPAASATFVFVPRTGTPTAAPSVKSVDDTTVEYGPTAVQGGTRYRISGRSVPGTRITVVTNLPSCSDPEGRETVASSVVGADGSYTVEIGIQPQWTELKVTLRFTGSDQQLVRTLSLTVLPTGRDRYCVP